MLYYRKCNFNFLTKCTRIALRLTFHNHMKTFRLCSRVFKSANQTFRVIYQCETIFLIFLIEYIFQHCWQYMQNWKEPFHRNRAVSKSSLHPSKISAFLHVCQTYIRLMSILMGNLCQFDEDFRVKHLVYDGWCDAMRCNNH